MKTLSILLVFLWALMLRAGEVTNYPQGTPVFIDTVLGTTNGPGGMKIRRFTVSAIQASGALPGAPPAPNDYLPELNGFGINLLSLDSAWLTGTNGGIVADTNGTVLYGENSNEVFRISSGYVLSTNSGFLGRMFGNGFNVTNFDATNFSSGTLALARFPECVVTTATSFLFDFRGIGGLRSNCLMWSSTGGRFMTNCRVAHPLKLDTMSLINNLTEYDAITNTDNRGPFRILGDASKVNGIAVYSGATTISNQYSALLMQGGQGVSTWSSVSTNGWYSTNNLENPIDHFALLDTDTRWTNNIDPPASVLCCVTTAGLVSQCLVTVDDYVAFDKRDWDGNCVVGLQPNQVIRAYTTGGGGGFHAIAIYHYP